MHACRAAAAGPRLAIVWRTASAGCPASCAHLPAVAPVPLALPAVTHPPAQVAEVRAVLKPQDPRDSYPSTARNSIRSRAWAAPIEASLAAAAIDAVPVAAAAAARVCCRGCG